MLTPEHFAATGPTGPRTSEGKARAAQNSTKTGLFSSTDLVLEGEELEYSDTRDALLLELEPEGVLQHTFTTQILSATWRLRRCGLIEAQQELAPEDQTSVDRARAQANNLLRRALAELRKLQTESTLRFNLQFDSTHAPGLTESKLVLDGMRINARQRLAARKADHLDSLEGLIAQADKQLCAAASEFPHPAESSFCKLPAPAPERVRQTPGQDSEDASAGPYRHENKLTAPIPRSAPCPCNSGQKYKRCCGRNAPPVLGPSLNLAA